MARPSPLASALPGSTLLLVALALLSGCGAPPAPSESAPTADSAEPAVWDLKGLPPVKPLRHFDTPGGVRVEVLLEGKGEPLARGQAIDVQLVAYVRNGVIVERDTRLGLVAEPAHEIQGLVEGLAGIKVRERRRLLIPNALAYGAKGKGNLPPHTDLVMDVMRVQLLSEDLQVGTGATIRRGMEVVANYKGTLENGTEFDSSYRKGVPYTFRLPADARASAGVIEGWARGVLGMKVGGVRRLWIPYHLAYAERGSGKNVPPFANLNFVIEVVGASDL